MELLDRYLQAVGFWLPGKKKEDILAELSEDLHSQVEEREQELGHALDNSELRAILTRCGSPILVASRYLPQEHLIGPVLFPVYRFAMKMFALCFVLPWLVVWLVTLAVSPAYRAAHPMLTLPGTLGSLLQTAIYAFGITTLAFALIERSHFRSAVIEKWNPDKLPLVRDPNRIPRSASVIEVIAGLIFVGWWMQLPRTGVLDLHGVTITWNATWQLIYWVLPTLMLAGAVLAVRHVARPYWTRAAGAVRLTIDLASLAFTVFLLKSGPWLSVEGGGSAGAGALPATMNGCLLVVLLAITLGGVIGVVQGLRRVAGLPPFRNPFEFFQRLEKFL